MIHQYPQVSVGDLVKIAFTSYNRIYQCKPGEFGIVIEESGGSCKILFPASGNIKCFIKDSVEVVSDLR